MTVGANAPVDRTLGFRYRNNRQAFADAGLRKTGYIHLLGGRR
jgi:hypothetical protein